jgi:hypothetical protein
MRISRSIVTHTLAAAGALAVAVAVGAGRGQPTEHAADPQKMMEQWMESMKPGKAHEFLEQFAGEWDTTCRVFMGGPGSAADETKGTATRTLVLGGKFVKEEHKGSMMGMPYEGIGFTGYDNTRKLYSSVWLGNLCTGLNFSTGSLDQTGKVLTQFGTMDEPMTGEIGKTVKSVTRVIDADHQVFEMWEVLYGEPFKVMEVAYARRK